MVRPIEAQNLRPAGTPAPNLALLAGLRVIIIEDDYYLAMEAKAVLEDAGARVIGPLVGFEPFQRALTEQRPNCAVVDINLGSGPSYAAALSLREAGVPFLFLTGYSADAIPLQFQDIVRAEKPAKTSDLVEAVRRLCP